MAIDLCQSIINGDAFKINVAMAQTDDRETMGPSNENDSSTSLLSTTTTANKTQGENYGPIQKEEAAKPNRQITLVTEDTEIDIAPGKRVKTWTFNGTVPGPTIRLAEGENVTIKYINKSPIPHTIHFHGNHDDVNDGVTPQIMPNQTYLYNITGEPAGALMYHCHAPPTSLHIRMGMYGALIVDPIDKPVLPAKEFVMVMGEYSLKNQLGFDADYYFINGYADQYVHNPLQINHGDLMRIYLINLGTTIPASFHLHSATFLAYPSGLWINTPIHAQTVSVAPGDASIVEAKWKYPGDYFFHAHGIQEEKGNMGMIKVAAAESNGNTTNSNTSNVNTANSSSNITSVSTAAQSPVTNSIGSPISENNNSNNNDTQQQQQQQPPTGSLSMFDWQYELQKKLQSPQLINYSSEGFGKEREGAKEGSSHMTETKETQRHGENLSLSLDKPSPQMLPTQTILSQIQLLWERHIPFKKKKEELTTS
ncbi:MAG TPA: multicopper oxidase domain-containing protein [Phototrophicaceae bacterium]|nr:multicopper oxidase domain-containing protein [Phototrophicaceae bacterium]